MADYEMIFDYRSNKHYGNELMTLIKKEAAKSSYESWISRSKWDENYIPFALVNENGDILANLGIVRLYVYANQVRYQAVQLIGLLVNDDYKNQGLDKLLIQKVLAKYDDLVDLIYSYDPLINNLLNDEVGFANIIDCRWCKNWSETSGPTSLIAKRIDTTSTKELRNLWANIKHSARLSPTLSTSGDASIKIYNILKYFSRNVYYIPSKDVYVIFTIDKDVFKLIGVHSKCYIDWDELLKTIVPANIKKIEFGFMPPTSLGDVYHHEASEPITNYGPELGSLMIKVISGEINTSPNFFFPMLSRGK
ncbi:hypothetical protein JN01_0479 [Entomoplasma freundtii]|uniref:Uncharacterized protein n=1 Tax=Entomoplasma freundtii TaxID=74700 RepID=A0A2K8NTN9_9MOLU|nr:hypothetical protein [Entomoplasma freundtii]ATZ16121.1 hypothetical protein EFREU_v1c00940 [Entomoplasma freundtii]TDY56978.1 hypothetical protein JN01_0479 [Entomoplasma freundtii]